MNRRSFLRMMIGGATAVAAERVFPFRVFSFPSQIVPATFGIPIDWAKLARLVEQPDVMVMHPKQKEAYDILCGIPVYDDALAVGPYMGIDRSNVATVLSGIPVVFNEYLPEGTIRAINRRDLLPHWPKVEL